MLVMKPARDCAPLHTTLSHSVSFCNRKLVLVIGLFLNKRNIKRRHKLTFLGLQIIIFIIS